jgi:fibronectin-binding autotransporter adhesin
MKAVRSPLHHVLALALLALPSLSVVAADQTWNGGTDTQWTTTANWSGNALPGAADAVIYNNLSVGQLSNWLSQAFSIKGLVVSNVPGPVSINSTSTLTFTNGINMSQATRSLAIAAPVALGAIPMKATLSWNVATGQTLTVSGPISGSAGLYKDGPGALYLSGTNTFTGSVTNNGGPLWISHSSALGTGNKTISVANNLLGPGLHLNGTNGNITLASGLSFTLSQNAGAVFNEAGDNVLNGNISVYSGGGFAYLLANAGTLTLNGTISLGTTARPIALGGAANGTVNGAISSDGLAVRKLDAGTWTLKNTNNTYTGVTTIEGGTLALGPNATLAKTPSITVFSNATLDVSALTNNPASSNAYFLSGGTTVQTLAGSGTVNGNVLCANTAYIVPGGSNAVGTLTVTTNLTLNSGAVISFELNTDTTPGNGINDLVNVGGNLDPQSATINITALSPLTVGGIYRLFNYGARSATPFYPLFTTDTRYTFALVDTGTSPGGISVLVLSGNGNLVWSGGAGSTWDVNSSLNWNGNTQPFLTEDNVTFDDSSPNNNVNLAVPVRPASVNVTNNTANYAFFGPGKLTGSTGLAKSGAGFLTNLNATCDFTGPVVINGGTLVVTNAANSGIASALGAGTSITLNGGGLQWAGPTLSAGLFNRPFTLGANGGAVSSSSVRFYLGGPISGPGSLTKSGTVQIILGDIAGGIATGANNSYSGNTYVNQGELQFRNPHALGSGRVVVSSGADLAAGGGGNFGTITNDMDLNGDGPSSAGALQVNDNTTSATFAGTIQLVTSASVGTFGGSPSAFTISGPIIGPGALKKASHTAGTVILTCPTNSYSGGTLITGGTLQLGNGGVAGSLGSAGVTNNGTLAYNHSNRVTNSLAISSTGGLTHSGSGTLVLSGTNSFSGATTVSGGTLLINGSLGTNTLTVVAGATLGGYGSIGGPVTVANGGTLALGSSLGSLTVISTLALNGNTVRKISKTGTTLLNDSIQGMSTVTFGGVLNVSASGAPLAAGDSFRLFNATTYAGAFTATNLPSLATNLVWDTSGLTNGTLTVVNGSPSAAPSSSFSSFTQLPDGTCRMTFSGTPGFGYRLWASTNVARTPVTSTWTMLTTNAFGTLPVTVTDTNAPNFSRRFYVISMP